MAHMFCSALHQAVYAGDIVTLKTKLVTEWNRVNVQDKFGWTPLHVAVMQNRKDMVTALLNHPGIKVNCRNAEGSTSLLLTFGFQHQNLHIVKDLLEHGADPNIRNYENVGPLHLACNSGNLELVKLLILHQADVNSQDWVDRTPLIYAITSNAPQVIEYLLAHNADANLTGPGGANALMYTVDLRRSYFELLLPHTQNLDALTKGGYTALLLAIKSSYLAAVLALLERGASLTVQCAFAPLKLAITLQCFDMFELIWQHTHLNTVSENRDFMRFVCKHCPLPRCYRHYELILNTPGVDLHVDGASRLFHCIFRYGPPVHAYLGAAESQYLNVIGWLLDRRVQLHEADIKQILWYFRRCPYAVGVWKVIFAKATPNITHFAVQKAINYQNYDVALLFISHCLHLMPECVSAYQAEVPETFLRNFLALFTPNSQYRKVLTWPAVSRLTPSTMQIVNETKQVMSLLELSRNAVRRAMHVSCNTTEDFLLALGKLEIPTHLKDVIRLRIPVNKYMLED